MNRSIFIYLYRALTWQFSIYRSNLFRKGKPCNRSDKPPIDIELRRSGEGLGITISGGYGSAQGNMPIFIKSVASKGAAADEGRLKAGDQILSVNGEIRLYKKKVFFVMNF